MASMDGKKAREARINYTYIVYYILVSTYIAGKERNERRMGKLIKST